MRIGVAIVFVVMGLILKNGACEEPTISPEILSPDTCDYELPGQNARVYRVKKDGLRPTISWVRHIDDSEGGYPDDPKNTHTCEGEISADGTGSVAKTDRSYLKFVFTISSPSDDYVTTIEGTAKVTGEISIDITDGCGYGEAYAWGKSKVMYGNTVLTAEDEDAIAVCTIGSSKSIGGSVTVMGFGGGVNTNWVEDQPQAQIKSLMDVDSGLEEEAGQALTEFTTTGNANISSGATGTASWEAKAAAMVIVRLEEKD